MLAIAETIVMQHMKLKRAYFAGVLKLHEVTALTGVDVQPKLANSQSKHQVGAASRRMQLASELKHILARLDNEPPQCVKATDPSGQVVA
eukprot:4404137-Amphidinium_carterae.1